MADAQSQPDALALADSVKFAIQHRDEEISALHSELDDAYSRMTLMRAVVDSAQIMSDHVHITPKSEHMARPDHHKSLTEALKSYNNSNTDERG